MSFGVPSLRSLEHVDLRFDGSGGIMKALTADKTEDPTWRNPPLDHFLTQRGERGEPLMCKVLRMNPKLTLPTPMDLSSHHAFA